MAEEPSSKGLLEDMLKKCDYIGETSVKKSEITTFSWVIKNCEELLSCEESLQSPTFCLRDDPAIKCFINLKCSNCKTYLDVQANFTGNQSESRYTVKFYNLNHKMEHFNTRTATRISDFATRFTYFRNISSSYVAGSMLVGCDVSSKQCSTLLKSNILYIPKSELYKDFSSLFNDKSFSDCTIISKGKKFSVHRAILAARSKVFAAMFRHDLEEIITNTVKIHDAETEVLTEFLRFIYTDNVMCIEKFALKLLELADRFDLQRLKAICANELVKFISVSSALETLIIADRHKISDLENITLNFIKSRLGEIVALTDYDSFCKNHPDLVSRILRNMA